MAAEIGIEIELLNKQRLIAGLERAKRATEDLRLPLGLIRADFYKSEKSIFRLKSPGQYDDLNAEYKKAKAREVGFVYPILKRTGRLEESVTSPSSPDSNSYIINKDTLVIETKVPYAIYHQEGTSKMPRRPFFIIGPESPKHATSEMQGRLERWLNILNDYAILKTQQELEQTEIEG